MRVSRLIVCMIAMGLLILPVPASSAQKSRRAKAQANAQGSVKPGGAESPFMRLVRSRAFDITFRVRISKGIVVQVGHGVEPHNFRIVRFYMPMPLKSGTAALVTKVGPDGPVPIATAKVRFGAENMPIPEYEYLPADRLAGGYGVWTLESKGDSFMSASEVTFETTYSVVCSRANFDERGASEVDWPAGEWPAEALQALEPQLWIEQGLTGDFDPQPVIDFLNTATEGRNPKSIKPVVLAKWLTGKLAENVQVNGKGLYAGHSRTGGTVISSGNLEGFELQGASATIATGKGSEMDVASALVAVFREAGLPARLVIGYDAGSKRSKRRDGLSKRSSGSGPSAIRPYVEFALYDEKSNSLAWIPVDIVNIRKSSSRLPENFMDMPLKHFGNGSELEWVAPLAFYVHPPILGLPGGYRPGIWGVSFSPTQMPGYNQFIDIRSSTSSKRGKR